VWKVPVVLGDDRPDASQTEVGDLGDDVAVLYVEQDVGGFDVPVHQARSVRMAHTPGHLDRQVHNARHGRLRAALVQTAVGNPVVQAAAADVLGEDVRDVIIDHAHVVAPADVRVQPERDPRLGLGDEPLALLIGREHLRLRRLDRQVDSPLPVQDPQHPPHPALTRDPLDLVAIVENLLNCPVAHVQHAFR
jgi:hypothetical protein